jgi:hypothetical protein
MPAGDNPHSISEKKAALRESPKQSKNAVVNQQARASLFPKDKAAEIVGVKRPQPNGPLSPASHHVPGNPGPNGHLVYVRRKIETDQSKGGASAGAESATSLSSRKPVLGAPQEQSLKHQSSVPNTQSAHVSASPAAPASIPALHSASLPAHLSFAKQSLGKVSVQPSVAVALSPPQCNVEQSLKHQNSVPNTQSAPVPTPPAAPASIPALHSASLPAHLSFAKQSPGKVSVQPSVAVAASPPQRNVEQSLKHQNSVPNTQSAPVPTSPAAPASIPALHPASLPAHVSFAKQSPGKVSVQPSVSIAATPPQRNAVATAMPQNFTAANSASPPQRNVVATAMPQNFTAAKTASPPQRIVVSTAIPQNFTAANTASPLQRNVVSSAMPQNFTAASPPQHTSAISQNLTAANTASPTHRNVVSTSVPQNFTTASMAPCNVAAASTASRDAVATTTARSPASLQRSSNQDWKERFIRLQAFLRNNEQSGQEEYVRSKLSLSKLTTFYHTVCI